jgi:aminoglycoside 6'-N-acetyltransferase
MSRPLNTRITLRPANLADVPLFERWDRQLHVISATTDDPAAEKAFNDACWPDEVAAQDEHSRYLIAEFGGRPIGAMQMIDPHLESTHYWGGIRPNLRALDIWIGEPDCLGKGYGETMMRRAFMLCFADPAVTAIVIDPLASNVRAHRFYRRLGFKPVGRREFGDDACLVHDLKREDWLAYFAEDAAAVPEAAAVYSLGGYISPHARRR